MTALFSDWDLAGDLDQLLSNAKGVLEKQREYVNEYDAGARQSAAIGEPLTDWWHDRVPEIRARLRHYERQIVRISDAIAKRDEAEREKKKRGSKR